MYCSLTTLLVLPRPATIPSRVLCHAVPLSQERVQVSSLAFLFRPWLFQFSSGNPPTEPECRVEHAGRRVDWRHSSVNLVLRLATQVSRLLSSPRSLGTHEQCTVFTQYGTSALVQSQHHSTSIRLASALDYDCDGSVHEFASSPPQWLERRRCHIR